MKNIIIIIFLLISNYSNSQIKFKEICSKEYENKKVVKELKKSILQNAIKVDKNYYAILNKYQLNLYYIFISVGIRYIESDFVLIKLDEKLNVVDIKKIPSVINTQEVNTLSIIKLGEDICALFYLNNMKHKKQYLFAQKYNIKTMEPKGSMYKIGETILQKRQRYVGCRFVIKTSPENDQLLITNDNNVIPNNNRQARAIKDVKSHLFSYWLYDSEFNILSNSNNFKLGKGNSVLTNIAFDKKGNIAFLGYEEKKRENSKKKKKEEDGSMDESNNFILRIINTNGKDETIRFGDDRFFYTAKMVFNPNTGNLGVVAMISSGNYGASGFYLAQVDIDKAEIISSNTFDFSSKFIEDVNILLKSDSKKSKKSNKTTKQTPTKKSSKSNKKNNPNYIRNLVNLGDCFYNDSNELVAICQEYYWYVVRTTTTDGKGNTTTTYRTYYVYDNIHSFKFDNTNEFVAMGILKHHNEYNYRPDKDYQSLYKEDLYIITNSSYGKVNFNNKLTKMDKIKNQEILFKGKSTQTVKLNDEELFVFNRKRKSLYFGKLYLN